MRECWKLAPFHPKYEVSNFGNLRKTNRYGMVVPVPLQTDKAGYQRFQFWLGGKRTCYTVHKAVLLTFVGPRPDGLVTRHRDGNPSNNNLSNLCYGTEVENAADKKLHGTYQAGEDHPGAVLTNAQAAEIKEIYATGGRSKRGIARHFDVSEGTVRRILRGDGYN